MKHIFLLILAVIVSSFKVSAQKIDIKPENGSVEFNDVSRPCIQVNVDPETKETKKAWKKYLSDNYSVKIKGIGMFSNKDILFAEEIVFKEISDKRLNLYTEIIEDLNGSQIKLFVSFGYDVYINEKDYPEEYKQLEAVLINFLKIYLPKYYKEKVNDVEKRISSLNKETRKLKDELVKISNEIEDLKKEILELESELTDKEISLESTKVKLEISTKKLEKRKKKLDRILKQLKNI